jgi:uncharacterized protein YuzE
MKAQVLGENGGGGTANSAMARSDDQGFVRGMKIKYFQDTDTLYIEFRAGDIAATRDLDENTQLDIDPHGNICAITVEHARERADLPHFSFEQVGT